jgi:hypothetical protein
MLCNFKRGNLAGVEQDKANQIETINKLFYAIK